MHRSYDLIVVGDAMVDVTVKAPEGKPGGAYSSEILVSPGGLANVAAAARLSGARTGFFGAIGRDCFGDLYETDLEGYGVKSFLSRCDAPTGLCVNLVSPLGERTMYTNRGANDCLSINQAPPGLWGDCGMVFLSAFSLESHRAGRTICKIARKAKASRTQIALGGGSFNLLQDHRLSFSKLAACYADQLILNRAEALAIADSVDLDSAVDVLKGLVDVLIITLGKGGSLGFFGGRAAKVPAIPAEPLDTTGAGDVFAGAFLGSILKGEEPERSMRQAAQLASQSVSVLGPRGVLSKGYGSRGKSDPQ